MPEPADIRISISLVSLNIALRPSLRSNFTTILFGSVRPTIRYNNKTQEEIIDCINKVLGISSPVLTTREAIKPANPHPIKLAVSAKVTHKKCSLGANQADASTGGIASAATFPIASTASPSIAIA